MSRAEERALKAYPDYVGFDDVSKTLEHVRNAYVKGYKQAEQDFIEKACDAYCKVCGHYPHTTPDYICRQACDYYKDFRTYMKGK